MECDNDIAGAIVTLGAMAFMAFMIWMGRHDG